MTEAFIFTFGKAGHPFPVLKKHRTLFPIGHLKMEYIVAFVLFLQLSFSPGNMFCMFFIFYSTLRYHEL